MYINLYNNYFKCIFIQAEGVEKENYTKLYKISFLKYSSQSLDEYSHRLKLSKMHFWCTNKLKFIMKNKKKIAKHDRLWNITCYKVKKNVRQNKELEPFDLFSI